MCVGKVTAPQLNTLKAVALRGCWESLLLYSSDNGERCKDEAVGADVVGVKILVGGRGATAEEASATAPFTG